MPKDRQMIDPHQPMPAFWTNLFRTLVAAGIVALVAAVWQQANLATRLQAQMESIDSRLGRIDQRLVYIERNQQQQMRGQFGFPDPGDIERDARLLVPLPPES